MTLWFEGLKPPPYKNIPSIQLEAKDNLAPAISRLWLAYTSLFVASVPPLRTMNHVIQTGRLMDRDVCTHLWDFLKCHRATMCNNSFWYLKEVVQSKPLCHYSASWRSSNSISVDLQRLRHCSVRTIGSWSNPPCFCRISQKIQQLPRGPFIGRFIQCLPAI